MPTYTKFVPTPMIGYDEEEEFEFSTQENLLNLPCVSCWTKQNPQQDKNDNFFHRFSLKGNILVVEAFKGKCHVEIGSVSSTKELNFPEWTGVNETNTKER